MLMASSTLTIRNFGTEAFVVNLLSASCGNNFAGGWLAVRPDAVVSDIERALARASD